MVIAAIASVAGGRADSWEMAVPSLTWDVREPHHASGVQASLPYASAVHTWSSRNSSAVANNCAASPGGPELQ